MDFNKWFLTFWEVGIQIRRCNFSFSFEYFIEITISVSIFLLYTNTRLDTILPFFLAFCHVLLSEFPDCTFGQEKMP